MKHYPVLNYFRYVIVNSGRCIIFLFVLGEGNCHSAFDNIYFLTNIYIIQEPDYCIHGAPPGCMNLSYFLWNMSLAIAVQNLLIIS